MNKYDMAEHATANASYRIKNKGFGDLLNAPIDFGINVSTYTDEDIAELDETGRDWIGQYLKGSIDNPSGTTVLLAIDKHNSIEDMTDTILHEVGHALWELINPNDQNIWNEANKDHKYGPEEAFADDFMNYCQGLPLDMNNLEMFEGITQPTDTE